jgi:hypothetical protein
VVFDVYIDDHERLWLIDFNPYAPVTDALLFDWEELPIPECIPDQFRPRVKDDEPTTTTTTEMATTNGERRIDFRVIESEADVRVMSAGNKFPVDAGVDVSNADSIEALVRLMQAQSS